MKLSNFILSIVASVLLGVAVGSSVYLTPKNPSTDINLIDKSVPGARWSFKIPDSFTEKQAKLLSLAYSIAKEDGHKEPQLLQGIILQESHAGEIRSYKVAGQEMGLKTNARYYGVAQIKLSAARDVLNKYPNMEKEYGFHTDTDEEVIAKLIDDDKFNIAVASKYLLIMRSYGYNTLKEIAVAYNRGPGGAKNVDANQHHYSKGVMAHIQSLKI